MKLTNEVIDYILNVVKTVKIINIDSLIIEEGYIRGMTPERNAFVLQTEDIPELGFKFLGITKPDVFETRVNLIKDNDKFNINVTLDDDNEYVQRLSMSAGRTRTEFHGANQSAIKSVKNVRDEFVFNIKFKEEDLNMLQRASGSVASDVVCINADGTNVSFIMSEYNSDVFEHSFFESTDEFSNKYSLRILLSLLKQNSTGEFKISDKGVLKIIVNDLAFYIIPSV